MCGSAQPEYLQSIVESARARPALRSYLSAAIHWSFPQLDNTSIDDPDLIVQAKVARVVEATPFVCAIFAVTRTTYLEDIRQKEFFSTAEPSNVRYLREATRTKTKGRNEKKVQYIGDGVVGRQ